MFLAPVLLSLRDEPRFPSSSLVYMLYIDDSFFSRKAFPKWLERFSSPFQASVPCILVYPAYSVSPFVKPKYALAASFLSLKSCVLSPLVPATLPFALPSLSLGGSLACFAADVLAPVLLSINDHDAAAAPLLVPLFSAPAAVPVTPTSLEWALSPQRAHSCLSPEFGRRRPRDSIADHPAARLSCLTAAS